MYAILSPMNQLHIYPTSRALRTVSSHLKEQDGFLPALMRMDEFEQRAILIENKIQIDPLQRILLLREAAGFEAFEDLHPKGISSLRSGQSDLSLVRFFTKSDALFKFFEELAGEQVGFDTLAEADAYAEFEVHLSILERLLANYKKLLDAKGFTDKVFIPGTYILNKGFLDGYESIEIHLEGYLSHFELELLEKVAQQTQLTLHYTTSKFNMKMQERLESIGISLPNNKHVSFSMTDKKVINAENNNATIDAKVFSVEEKEEQVALAFTQIEQMVNDGIAPEEIVLILPDESFKEHFTLFDVHHNLNFAMGYDYSKGRVYKSLEALYGYWQNFDADSKYLLERYGFDLEDVEKISATKRSKVERFFVLVESLGLLDCPLVDGEKKEKYNERVYEKYLHFIKIFETQELSQKEWLFLWLKTLSQITIDDVRGGMITVMGVLETRGVSFEGVVIVDFNEGIVPATSSKDQFLNSSVRTFANLPTKHDREALQKQYYKRLLEILDLEPALAPALQDWIDADINTRFPDGAEDDVYLLEDLPYRAANRPVVSISELRLVKGFTPEVIAVLEPHVTALPEETVININTATPAVLRALHQELDDSGVEQLLADRGKEGYEENSWKD